MTTIILTNFENKYSLMKNALLSVLFVLACSTAFSQKKLTNAEYIAKYKNLALQEMQLYKIPASIILAQGVIETSNGFSELAQNANNHFGIKCKEDWTGEKYYYDDDAKNECFRKYSSDTASYRDHSVFLSTRKYYKSLFLLDICDYKGWAYGLKQAGYATEPRYAEMLIKVIEDNKLYNLDCQGKLFIKDTNKINPVKPNDVKEVASSEPIKISGTLKPKTNSVDDFGEIDISGNSRKVYTNNGVKYIKARKKDNFDAIANDFGLFTSDLLRYNDLKQTKFLKEGDIVYIESKKKKAENEFHIVKSGETLHSISQSYGIMVKELCVKNHIKQDSVVKAGQKLWLKNTKPQY